MPGATDLSQARIGQISITVHNLGRAVAFYSEKLGLKHLCHCLPHVTASVGEHTVGTNGTVASFWLRLDRWDAIRSG